MKYKIASSSDYPDEKSHITAMVKAAVKNESNLLMLLISVEAYIEYYDKEDERGMTVSTEILRDRLKALKNED